MRKDQVRRICMMGAVLLISTALTGCLSGDGEPYFWQEQHDLAKTTVEKGSVDLLYSDYNALNAEGLQTDVIPWKVVTAALLFKDDVPVAQKAAGLRKFFRSYGFLYPKTIMNLPQSWGKKKWPLVKDSPIGLVRGYIDLKLDGINPPQAMLPSVEGAVVTCVSCHSSVAYDAAGRPQVDRIWLGLPNSSLNVQGYVSEIYRSLNIALNSENKARFKKYLRQMYPNAPETKPGLFLNNLLGQIQKMLKKTAKYGGLVPFHNGFPGITNGVAAMKYILKSESSPDDLRGDRGFTSIPALYDREFRSSFLYDGTYGVVGKKRFTDVRDGDFYLSPWEIGSVVAYFTIPTMGNSQKRAEAAIPQVSETLQFMVHAKRPRWPGPIDQDKAERGYRIFSNSCAHCHGRYEFQNGQSRLVEFPNRWIPLNRIQTDPVRAEAITPSLVDTIQKGVMGRYVDVVNTGGYVAPILTAVSLTAPYLHNGSVPTLWDFMHPAKRPTTFYVGGHELDMQKVGIRAPAPGYTPFSRPVLYDTRLEGQSHRGHERQFKGMNDQDIGDLIEFLKTL